MRAKASMPSVVSQAEPLRHPCNGQGGDEGAPGQRAFDFNTPVAHTQEITDITRDVAEQFWGHDALAADMGVSRQLLGLKLRRGIDTKGDVVKMHLDVIGFLWTDPQARWAWANRIALAVGAKPLEPAREATDGEKKTVLASALSPEVKRALEKANGLPKGSLDR